MSYHSDDTICAIGTAGGGAARGMIRISGADAVAFAARVFAAEDGTLLDVLRQPTAIGGRLTIALASEGERTMTGPCFVPCDLYVWPTVRSYTREPVAELHTIGSAPVLQAALAGVCRAGARLAEPGEFTLRAFLAGRIDLTQAEAVLGVIDATDSSELDSALAQLAGGLARPLHLLREDLLQLLAELEAGLDFVEEDIAFIPQSEVLKRLQSASLLLEDVRQQMQSRHAAIDLKQVVLTGLPNAGKSSLFNAMVERYGSSNASSIPKDSALVSSTPGTTRDYLTATLSLNGVRCELVDTAGLEVDGLSETTWIDSVAQTIATERRDLAFVRARCIALPCSNGEVREGQCDLVILTKSDLAGAALAETNIPQEIPVVATSSQTGMGLVELGDELRALLMRDATEQRGPIVAATAERCGESIRLAKIALGRAAELVALAAGDELVAAELRAALAELGKVVGVVYTDDLLDRIFKTFCIGK